MDACPYQDFAPANLVLCEADLCGWITQPAAAWSNVGFLIVASILWKWSRDDESLARFLAPIALLTGLGSFAFHATGTLAGQLIDQSLMFLETSLFIVIGARRVERLQYAAASTVAMAYVVLVVGSIAFILQNPTTGIRLFVVHVAMVAILEVKTWWTKPRARLRYGLGAVATVIVSFVLWSLDASHTLCDPDNHLFTAHAAWHLLGAASFLLWYRHFAQR